MVVLPNPLLLLHTSWFVLSLKIKGIISSSNILHVKASLMTELKDPLSRAETGDLGKFSKLEASLVQTEVQQRPNSRAQNDINRHAQVTDLNVNELDFDFNLDATNYPLHNLNSLQQVLDAVQCHEHLKMCDNFSPETDIDCLHVDSLGAGKIPRALLWLRFLLI